MKVNVAYYTGTGNVRENNEDSLLVYNEIFSDSDFECPIIKKINIKEGFFSVADGIGGHAGGEIASHTALACLEGQKIKNKEELKILFRRVSDKLNSIAAEIPKLLGLGTVITGVYLKKNSGIIFNIGDSRTYFMRDKLIRLTDDHSFVWDLMKKENFTTEEEKHEWLRKHPQKNIITSALIGGLKEFQCQLLDIELKEGDKFFICSDGVWEELTFKEMENALSKEVVNGSEDLFKKCKINGDDNISFVLVEIISI